MPLTSKLKPLRHLTSITFAQRTINATIRIHAGVPKTHYKTNGRSDPPTIYFST